MNLSLVVCTWNRSSKMLLNSVHTLSNQTDPPREIIVVDTNINVVLTKENQNACAKYPLVKFIHAPRNIFNLAWGMNVGIKQAEGEYIVATCMEMLFSNNVVESISKLMQPGIWCQSVCGMLPIDPGDIETVHARWTELISQIEPGSNVPVSAGAIMIATKDWWHSIRGYDETHYPYENPDADLDRAASFSGLKSVRLAWDMCQMLHPRHERLKASQYQSSQEWFYGTKEEEVRKRERNPRGWGEM